MVTPIKPTFSGKAAQTPAPAPAPAPTAASADAKTTDQLRQEVQDRLNQIQSTESEQSAYLSDTDIAELDHMQSLLQGSLAVLDAYDKTGGALPNGTVATTPGVTLDTTNLSVGWNGAGSTPQADGTIYPENTAGKVDANGNPISGGLVFKMDDTMESVTGMNVGNDIQITVTYNNGTPDKTYLLKGMVSSPTPLMIAGDQTTKGITVNMSQVKRVGNKTPGVPDLIILGGSGVDTLIGSQGADEIHGGAGADTIYGLGAATGQDVLQGDAGDDTIYGGAGYATLTGGEGYDTLYSGGSDNKLVDPEDPETIPTTAFTMSDTDKGQTTGWTAKATGDGKELDITNDSGSGGGNIQLTIPNGYLVYGTGTKDGNDLVLTLQHLGPNGIPDGKTEVVRIEGILDTTKSPAHLSIISDSAPDSPNMIDLGSVNVGFNQITLQKGQGNDMIVSPHTGLGASLGINASQFGQATTTPGATGDIGHIWDAMGKEFESLKSEYEAAAKDATPGTTPDGFQGWATDPDTSGNSIILTPKADQKSLDIPTPSLDGYQYWGSVAQLDQNGKDTTITCVMKSTSGGPSKTLIIHVHGMKPEDIKVAGSVPANAAAAVQLLTADGDTGGGVFVGNASEIDTTGVADGNKIID